MLYISHNFCFNDLLVSTSQVPIFVSLEVGLLSVQKPLGYVPPFYLFLPQTMTNVFQFEL